jgi:hypothetical protein
MDETDGMSTIYYYDQSQRVCLVKRCGDGRLYFLHFLPSCLASSSSLPPTRTTCCLLLAALLLCLCVLLLFEMCIFSTFQKKMRKKEEEAKKSNFKKLRFQSWNDLI